MKSKLEQIHSGIVFDVAEMEEILKKTSIFDKIEFSGISKESIREKIEDLEERQVPKRDVLLTLTNEEVTEYWFKNWLHPRLKHAVPKSSRDKRGCSQRVLEQDVRQDVLNFYENGQQNFTYSLDDVKKWAGM